MSTAQESSLILSFLLAKKLRLRKSKSFSLRQQSYAGKAKNETVFQTLATVTELIFSYNYSKSTISIVT